MPGTDQIIDVVLPCLNEREALPFVLGRMPPGFRAIVVDNGSTDGSAQVALALGATVVEAAERGYGAACHAGLLAATSDVVCVMDADASIDPSVLPQLSAPVLSGSVDLVVGRRRPTSMRAWPLHARIANKVLVRELRRSAGVPVRDLGPVRAFRREALLGLDLRDRRCGYPVETLLAAAAAGWRIVDVDVDYLPRRGRSKVTGTFGGTVLAIRDIRRVLAGG